MISAYSQPAVEYESIITVRFHPEVSTTAINNITSNLNLTELRRTKSNFIDYQLADGADVMAIANSLRDRPQVEAVQLNPYGETFLSPNDDLVGFQWHIDRLNLEEVWDNETGSEKVIVAIIDSGLDYNHPDIGFGDDGYSNLYFNDKEDDWSDPDDPNSSNGIDDDENDRVDDWRGWNSAEDSNDIRDTGSHGTRMAGFIAAKTNNEEGIAGVAGGFDSPGVKILSIKWRRDGETPTASSLAHAIDYATDQGARVINMSIGLIEDNEDELPVYPAIAAAIDRAVAHGVILVAAAGNPINSDSQGEQGIAFPARHPNVICISGIDQSDQAFGDFGLLPPFGDGEETSVVDFVAPSVDLQSTTLSTIGDGYEISDGTSDGTAITTGIIGLLVSADLCADREQIFEVLKNTAEKINATPQNDIYTDYPDDLGRHQKFGYGLINPLDAILSIRNGLVPNPIAGSTTTFNTSENISKDYTIPTGATVIVGSSGVLNMAPDTRIIIERGAKLIVDGGKITTCRPEKWRSIFVMGNGERAQPTDPAAELDPEDAGVLWIKNGGTIENARNAVATRHPDQYWLSEYWGGLVVAEDAIFDNNRRAVEFMSYTQNNQSRFINTTFNYEDEDDNLAAVTIWDTDNITFEGCTFRGYDTGVIAYDAGCNMNENVLEECDYGLEILATSPVSSGAPVSVSDNIFRDIRFDAISSHSANIPKLLDIQDNQFANNSWSIYLNGLNDFRILDNRIEGGSAAFVGIHTQNIGLGLSEINCNTINGIEFAIAGEGDCSGLSVLDNGFSSAYSDLSVWEAVNGNIGKLAPSHGQENTPANNCFSSGHAEHLASYGHAEPYTYYVPDNVANTDCRIPLSDGGNDILETTSDGLIECDRPFPFDDPGDDKYAYLDLLDRYQIVREAPYQNGGESAKELYREIRSSLHHWLLNGLENGVNSDVEDVLLATDSKAGLQQLYGIHLERKEMTLAEHYLEEIDMQGDAVDFVAVQSINLARLKSTGQAFELDQQQTQTLQEIAGKSTSAGNHAKGLLSLLRHEHFPARLNPLYYHTTGVAGGGVQSGVGSTIQAYPNPADELIKLRFLPYAEEVGLVELYNSLGHSLLAVEFSNTTELSLDVSSIINGLYTLMISLPDGTVSSLQVSIQH